MQFLQGGWSGVGAVFLTAAFLLPAIHVFGQEPVCPSECTCQAEGLVNCVGQQLQGVPTNLPQATRTLDLRSTGLSRLPGLSFNHVPELEVLRLDDNELGSDTVAMFGFVGLQKLKKLFLSGNQLTHSFLLRQSYYIPRSIRDLDLSRNPLTDVRERAFYFLQSLERLYLSRCGLSFLRGDAFVGLFSLQDLHIEDNLFTQVPSTAFKSVPNLRRLFMNGNPVHTLSAMDLTLTPNLELLDMRKANLSRIDKATFSQTLRLQTLLLSGNRNLSSVDKDLFLNVTDLTHLELADCAFSSAGTYVLTSLKSLTVLSIHGNPFACGPRMCGFRTWLDTTKVNVLRKYDIRCASPSNLQNVPVLNASISYLCKGESLGEYYASLAQVAISKCPYSCLCSTAVVECPDANLERMPESFPPQINKLVMRGNALKKIERQTFEKVRYVTWLDLSNNELTLDSFDEDHLMMLPFVKYFNVSNNLLSSYVIAEKVLPSTKLEELDMSHNPLGNIRSGNFRLLGLLRKLHLNDVGMTELTSFSFMGLFSLQELHLADNKITALPIKGFQFVGMVRRLVLQGNPITQLTDGSFRGMPQLTYLDVRNARLVRVEDNTFKYTPYLTELLLGYNKNLSYISLATFSTMPNLQIIDLSGCQFRSLSRDSLPRLSKLRAVSLHNNPWHCDGDLCWLKKMMLDRAVYILNLHQINCATPRYVTGDTIREVDNQFICPRQSQVPVVITNLIEDSILVPEIPDVKVDDICPEECQCYELEKRVDCSHARLTSVPYSLPPYTAHLNLAYNQIENISDWDFANVKNLQVLDLRSNLISTEGISKGAFKGLDNVRMVYLSNNKLSEISAQLGQLSYSLRVLDLSGNSIQTLEPGTFKSFRTLRDLVLSEVGLNTIKHNAFDGLKKLLRLSLAYNNLTTIPEELRRLPNLVELTVRGNSIRSLKRTSLGGLTSLEFLDLSELGLRVLEPGVFENLHVLDTLVLSDNNGLFNLNFGVFRGLSSLRTLRMTDCGLSRIDHRTLSDLPTLTALIIHGNPLECTADFCFFVNWLDARGISVENRKEVRCVQWSQPTTAAYAINDVGFRSFCQAVCGECTRTTPPMPTSYPTVATSSPPVPTSSQDMPTSTVRHSVATATLHRSTSVEISDSNELSTEVTTRPNTVWPTSTTALKSPLRIVTTSASIEKAQTSNFLTSVPKLPRVNKANPKDKEENVPHPNIAKVGDEKSDVTVRKDKESKQNSALKTIKPNSPLKHQTSKPNSAIKHQTGKPKSALKPLTSEVTTLSRRIPFLATGRGVRKGWGVENRTPAENASIASLSNIEPKEAEMVNNSGHPSNKSHETAIQRPDTLQDTVGHTAAPAKSGRTPRPSRRRPAVTVPRRRVQPQSSRQQTARPTSEKHRDVSIGRKKPTFALGTGNSQLSPVLTVNPLEGNHRVKPVTIAGLKTLNEDGSGESTKKWTDVSEVQKPIHRTSKNTILFSDVEGQVKNDKVKSTVKTQHQKPESTTKPLPPTINSMIHNTTRKEQNPFLQLPKFTHVMPTPFSPIMPSECPTGCGCYEELVRCSGTGLTRVPRLSYPRVELFFLSKNRIARIPKNVFTGLSSLRSLHLDNCHLVDKGITETSFYGLPHLKYLYLTQNRLTIVPTSLPSTLEYLYLDANQINVIEEKTFDQIPNLRSLYLQYNNLTSEKIHPEAFKSLTNLTSIYLQGNRLGKLRVIFPPSLEVVRLENNGITTVSPETFANLHQLRQLFLSDNSLKALPRGLFSELQSLEYITLAQNRLVTVPTDLPSSLVNLNLAGNLISVIPRTAFSGLQMLVSLNLSHNDLYDDRIMDTDIGSLKRLQQLHLSGNHLTAVPRNLPKSLQYLNLQGNLLSEKTANVENLKGSVGLKYLLLGENYFREVPVPLPPSLESLHLNNNLIVKIKAKVFAQTPRLKTLNLGRNMLGDEGLVRDSFFGTTNLEYLDVSGNHLNASLRYLPNRVESLVL